MKVRQLFLLAVFFLAACTTAPTATLQPESESTSAPEVTEAATEEVAAATEESAPTPRPTLGPDESGAVLNEPDSSWTNAIEAEWSRRFGAAR